MIRTQYLSEVQLKRDAVPSFKKYPFSLPAVRHLRSLELHPSVTFIFGENGRGNQPSWKRSRWRGDSTPKADREGFILKPSHPIQS